MKLKKTTIAAAVVTALTMGAAGQASASVYAGSRLLVENLVVGVSNLATGPGEAIEDFSFTTGSNATLNGTLDSDSATCSTLGTACGNVSPILDSAASVGAPVRNEGDFNFFGPGVGQTYAGSASEILTAELTQGIPTTGNQISEAEIESNGVGFTDSTLGSESSFNFTFTIDPGVGNLSLSFDANPDLFVAVDTENLLAALSTAAISATFNVVGSNGTQISWAPSGSTSGNSLFDFDDCAGVVSCVEVADEENLNITRTLPAGNPQTNGFSDNRWTAGSDLGMSNFQIAVIGLAPGDYTLSGTFTTFARAEQSVSVPEPGTLLLLGGGLAGLGFLGKRRRREDTQA